MPITVLYPPTPGPIGPGFSISLSTDFQGPILGPSHWEISIQFQNGEQGTLIQQFPNPSLLKQFQCIVGDLSLPLQVPTSRNEKFVDGTAVKLVANLVASAGQVDTGSQAYTYDSSSHLSQLLHTQTTANTGFTAQDRTNLQLTTESTSKAVPSYLPGQPTIVLKLADLANTFPDAQLCLLETVRVTGPQSLTRPLLGVPVAAYGAFIRIVSVPPEIGRIPGSVLLYQERIAQVAVISRDICGDEYVSDLVDIRGSGSRIRWGLPAPERIEIVPLPGAVLDWTWTSITQV